MTTIINAVASTGLTVTSDGSGVVKLQSAGVTTNALAWVNFDGTASTPITPRANYNISSITKNGTGDYTCNFTSAVTDTNYAAVVSASFTAGGTTIIPNIYSNYVGATYTTAPTTSAFRFVTGNRSTGAATDSPYITIAVFGN